MERYTEKVDGIWVVSCKYEEPPYPVVTQEVIDRLAAYEDTELSPEEIIELKGQNGGAREVKRLTHTLKSGSWGIRGDVDDAVLRLAAIEDILGDEYDLDRLRELVQADRERRTVSDLVRNMSDDELLELIEEIAYIVARLCVTKTITATRIATRG